MKEHSENTQIDLLQTLHKVLTGDNSLSCCSAIQGLVKIHANDETSQQKLIELLRDQNPDVRMEAVNAIGQFKSTDAVQALLYNLQNDPEGDVRIEVVKALARIKSPDSVKPLIDCVREDGYPHLDLRSDDMDYSPCWEVQSQALNTLGEIDDPRAVSTIIALLEDDDYEDLLETGYRVLAQLNTDSSRAFLLSQLKTGGNLARRRAAQAISRLAVFKTTTQDLPLEVLTQLSHALGDPDPAVRLYVARALGQTRNPLVVAPLILLLNDPDNDVRNEIASMLGKMRSKEVTDHLHSLLGESKNKHKRPLVHVLGEIAAPGSCEILMALLDSEDPDLLYEVIWALGEIGLPNPIIKLTDILENNQNDTSVRFIATQVLGKLLHRSKQNELQNRTRTSEQPQDQAYEMLNKTVHDENESISYARFMPWLKSPPRMRNNYWSSCWKHPLSHRKNKIKRNPSVMNYSRSNLPYLES